MTKTEVLDQYFIENRHKLIEVAAFLDRVDRAEGKADFRLEALRQALPLLAKSRGGRARRVLLALSDHTRQPIPKATTKSACGAVPFVRPLTKAISKTKA